MKHNFTLRRDNAELFKQRFMKLFAKTPVVESDAKYNLWGELKKFGVGDFGPSKTMTSTMIDHHVRWDTYPSLQTLKDKSTTGLILRLGSDSCYVFYFGQKFRITGNRVRVITETPSAFDKIFPRPKSRSVFRSSNITLEKDESDYQHEEIYSQMYWDSVSEEY